MQHFGQCLQPACPSPGAGCCAQHPTMAGLGAWGVGALLFLAVSGIVSGEKKIAKWGLL